MDKSEINRLMKEVKKQDETAFENLFNACKKGVFGFLYTYTKNYHDTEDLVQETFIKVKSGAQSYKDGTNAFAWMLEIAKNTAIDFIRRNNKYDTTDLESVTLSAKSEDTDTKMTVYDVINKYLADTDRQIVLLKLVYGYKSREIAGILGIPTGTVLWKYNRALKQLKAALIEVGYEE